MRVSVFGIISLLIVVTTTTTTLAATAASTNSNGDKEHPPQQQQLRRHRQRHLQIISAAKTATTTDEWGNPFSSHVVEQPERVLSSSTTGSSSSSSSSSSNNNKLKKEEEYAFWLRLLKGDSMSISLLPLQQPDERNNNDDKTAIVVDDDDDDNDVDPTTTTTTTAPTSPVIMLPLPPAAAAANDTTSDESSTSPASSSSSSLATLIATRDDLSSLSTAIASAGIATGLNTREGPFTLLAPTNQAFAATAATASNNNNTTILQWFMPEWVVHLRVLLAFHLSSAHGAILSTNLVDGIPITTLVESGETITVEIDDDNGIPSFVSQVPGNTAKVVEADIAAWNGVMHIVDAVLIPTSLTLNLMQVTFNDPDLDTLVGMITSVGLEDFFKDSGAFTILAPTNDAFTALTDTTTQVVTSNPDLLSNILMFHVLADVYPIETMTDGMEIVTTQGSSVTVSINNTTRDNDTSTALQAVVTLNGMAQIMKADQIASNGLVHKLNAVMFLPPSTTFDESNNDGDDETTPSSTAPPSPLPPNTTIAPSSSSSTLAPNTNNNTSGTAAPTTVNNVSATATMTTTAPPSSLLSNDNNLLEVAVSRNDLATFVGLMTVAGLDLANLESGTLVLAPTEDAFTALGEDLYRQMVLPENSAQLYDILMYHIYHFPDDDDDDDTTTTTMLSGSLSNGQILTSMEGSTTTIDISDDGTIGFNNFNARAIETDIIASNGVIYTIDAVLLPPSARS